MSLKDVKAPIFFMLMVKCDVIGKEIDAPKDSSILMKSENFQLS